MWKVVWLGILSAVMLICVILNTYSLLKNFEIDPKDIAVSLLEYPERDPSDITAGRILFSVFCILFTSAAFIFDMYGFVKAIVKLTIA